MSVFKPGTKYGLILSNKGAAAASKPATSGLAARKKPSIFNQSDSDSDKSGIDKIERSRRGRICHLLKPTWPKKKSYKLRFSIAIFSWLLILDYKATAMPNFSAVNYFLRGSYS